MNTKPVCQLDHDGYFVSITEADESPLEPGVWLLPAGAIDADAPEVPEGYRAKWNGKTFDFEKNTLSEDINSDTILRPDDIKRSIIGEVQLRLDNFANTKNYDNILSACTYATSNVAKFRAEGQYCVDARDRTWAKLYEILDEVEAGKRPIPKEYNEIEPEMPRLEWPE